MAKQTVYFRFHSDLVAGPNIGIHLEINAQVVGYGTSYSGMKLDTTFDYDIGKADLHQQYFYVEVWVTPDNEMSDYNVKTVKISTALYLSNRAQSIPNIIRVNVLENNPPIGNSLRKIVIDSLFPA